MRGLSAAPLGVLWLLLALCPAPAPAHPLDRAESRPAAPEPSAPSAPRQIRLAAVGDVVFGRYLRRDDPDSYSAVSRNPDPLGEIAPVLRAADVAFANLETPLMATPRPLAPPGTYVFRGDPDRARLLRLAGLDVVSLANNHSTNLGLAGAVQTRGHLLDEGIRAVGAGASAEEALLPALIDAGGLRLAVLAFTLWNGDHAEADRGGALAHVRGEDLLWLAAPLLRAARSREGADWVVVSLHWGVEHAAHPDEEQRRLGRALIDAGADLVIGHHPHVLQDVERYRGGLIAYSLGNFLFDNPQLPCRQSALLRVTLSGAGPLRQLRDVELAPVLIGAGDFVPRLATGAEHGALAARLGALAPGVRIAPDPTSAASRLAPQGRGTAALARSSGWVDPNW